MQSPGLLIPISGSHITSNKPSSSSPIRQPYLHTPPRHSKELPFIYSPIRPNQEEFLNKSLYDDIPPSQALHTEVAAHNNYRYRDLHYPKDNKHQTNWDSPNIRTEPRDYRSLNDPDCSGQRVNTLEVYDSSRPYLNQNTNTNRFIKVLGEGKTSRKQLIEMSFDQNQQRRHDPFSHDKYSRVRNEYSGSGRELERARTPIRRINRSIGFPDMRSSEEHRKNRTLKGEEMGRMSAVRTKRDGKGRVNGYMVPSMKMKADKMFERLLKKEEMLSECSSGRGEVVSDLEGSMDADKTPSKQRYYGSYVKNDDGHKELPGHRSQFPHVEEHNHKTHRSIRANGRRYVESNNDYKIRRMFDSDDTELKGKLDWNPYIPPKNVNGSHSRKTESKDDKQRIYKDTASQCQSPQKNRHLNIAKVRRESSNIPLESKGIKHNRTYTLIESTV